MAPSQPLPPAAAAADAAPAAGDADTQRLGLTLNGEPHQVAAGATVGDLIAQLGRDPRTVAVERNGDLLPRAGYAATRLAAGDRIEVVHFVQGGSV
jgi:sulfur carrier protein